MSSELQRFGVSIDSQLLTNFDRLIEAKGYTNRSEAIRDLIRDCLVEEEWQNEQGAAVGSITMVYNHHLREMSDKLNDIQHQFHQQIISVLHVHLDAHNCLEVLWSRAKKRSSKLSPAVWEAPKGLSIANWSPPPPAKISSAPNGR